MFQNFSHSLNNLSDLSVSLRQYSYALIAVYMFSKAGLMCCQKGLEPGVEVLSVIKIKFPPFF